MRCVTLSKLLNWPDFGFFTSKVEIIRISIQKMQLDSDWKTAALTKGAFLLLLLFSRTKKIQLQLHVSWWIFHSNAEQSTHSTQVNLPILWKRVYYHWKTFQKLSNIYAFPQIKSKINSLTEFSYSLHCPNLGEQSAKICKEGFKLKLKP